METCHICKGTLSLEGDPVHCEDCTWDCDQHDEPECTPIYVLHADARRAVKLLRSALSGTPAKVRK